MHGNKKTFSCEVKVEVAGDHTAISTVINLCAYNRQLKCTVFKINIETA